MAAAHEAGPPPRSGARGGGGRGDLPLGLLAPPLRGPPYPVHSTMWGVVLAKASASPINPPSVLALLTPLLCDSQARRRCTRALRRVGAASRLRSSASAMASSRLSCASICGTGADAAPRSNDLPIRHLSSACACPWPACCCRPAALAAWRLPQVHAAGGAPHRSVPPLAPTAVTQTAFMPTSAPWRPHCRSCWAGCLPPIPSQRAEHYR